MKAKTSRDWLPLCFRAADRVCVLLAAAVLQPLGTEGGTALQEDGDGSWIEGEAHQEKKGKDNGWVRTPQNKVVEGGQRFQTPHVMHFQCWLLKLPLLLSSGHLQNSHISIIPKSFKNARPWGRHSFCLGFRWEPFSQRKETGHLERDLFSEH